MSEKYTCKGKLKTGEHIFVDETGIIFIEKDYLYLVAAKSAELMEARSIVAPKEE
jgi:hypothetical protein